MWEAGPCRTGSFGFSALLLSHCLSPSMGWFPQQALRIWTTLHWPGWISTVLFLFWGQWCWTPCGTWAGAPRSCRTHRGCRSRHGRPWPRWTRELGTPKGQRHWGAAGPRGGEPARPCLPRLLQSVHFTKDSLHHQRHCSGHWPCLAQRCRWCSVVRTFGFLSSAVLCSCHVRKKNKPPSSGKLSRFEPCRQQ